MNTSCPVCGDPLHPHNEILTTVAGHLVHHGGCAAVLATALGLTASHRAAQ
ncbi:MAG: hypothetical protein ACRDMV_24945 [Streptosporangiales bacterium]